MGGAKGPMADSGSVGLLFYIQLYDASQEEHKILFQFSLYKI